MIRRNVAQCCGFLALAVLCNFYGLPAQAQSWGQLKEAAGDAQSKRDFAAAEGYWRKALAAAGSAGPSYIQSLAGLARTFADADKASDAEATYKKILELSASDSGSDDIKNALQDYSAFLKKQKRESEAAEIESKFSLTKKAEPAAAIPLVKADPGADQKAAFAKDSETWNTLYKNGSEELNQKNYAKAEKSLKDALAIAEKYNNASMSQMVLVKLEAAALAQNKNAEGEDYSLRLVAAIRQLKGPTSADFAQALMNHGSWLRKLNRKPEAINEERKAEAINLKYNQREELGGAGNSTAAYQGVDVSGTKGGSVRQRAKSAQKGFGGMINDMVNSKEF